MQPEEFQLATSPEDQPPRSQAVCVERPSFGLLGSTGIRLGLEPSSPMHRRNTCANAQRDVDENIASKCMCAEDV
jgi:hypothetical protein